MPATTNSMPPCIVLGLETQIGLGIVRELGRAGISVIGIAHDPYAIGLSSRYLSRKLVIKQPRSMELINTIRTLGDELGPCCLFTISEANLLWLTLHKNDFGNVRPVIPNGEKLAIVLDKQRTLQAARTVGIQVPETFEIGSMEHAQTLTNKLSFPVVLKWKDPNAVEQKLKINGLAFLKTEYVYTSEQFLNVVRRYLPIAQWPIVQTYCPGYGIGQFFYMHHGHVVRRFQHIRIAEWPPEGGFSSVCDSVSLDQHTDLQEKSIALLQHIGWEGVAMVEYRWNPVTKQAVLMEINGRYWGSYPLSVHCHANFALIAYYIENGFALPELPLVRNGIRCRMMSTEIKRLIRIFLHPELIADHSFKIRRWAEFFRFFADFVRHGVRYYVWDAHDPKPYFADICNLLRHLVQRF
jgi:predicted ATP-grasp superfamily ATP-dependent carboligase